jgi:eukaryotic-like serine/threonine-protein kinase
MPAASHRGVLTEARLRQGCAELDRRLRAGELYRAEQLFAACPLLASDEDMALEIVYTEFVTREELGQRPTPEEFYARFPSWKSRLQRQFQVHELLRDDLAGPAEQPPALPPRPLRRLGNYELREEIARGGCGIVYRAWQTGLERLVAVKALRPEFSRSPRARQRFGHEARVMASLRHRHIIAVHEVGENRGVLFFSMDLAVGSLADRTARPGQSRQAARVLHAVAGAIQHAHERGVIHCDLKPSNILLDEQGEPLVSDFGLARLPEGTASAEGGLIGTPAYMAPEQLADARPLTAAADVWSLGVILYELLAGRRPFTARTLDELQWQVATQEPPPLGRRLPAEARLEALCRRCLEKEPGRRPASAAELAEELRLCL